MADSDAACAACGRKEGALLRCARCKTVWYCGAGCQRASWGEHKKACRLPPAPPPAHAPDVPAPPVAAPDVPGALSGGDVLAIGTSTPCRLLMLEPASGEVRFDDELSEGPLKITASPDGRYIAAGVGSAWKMFDTKAGVLRLSVPGHFSGGGCSCSEDERGFVAEVASFSRRGCALTGHSAVVSDIAFSPDGSRVATGSEDGTAIVWDAVTGEQEVELVHTVQVASVAFSTDGKRLWGGGWSDRENRGKIIEWDVFGAGPNGAILRTIPDAHTGTVTSLAASPDGTLLASGGSFDFAVKLWDATSGEAIRAIRGHRDAIQQVVFAPDSRSLASASADHSARVWDVETGALRFGLAGHDTKDGCTCESDRPSPSCKCVGHRAVVTSVRFSGDGAALATGSDDLTVKIWQVTTGALLRTHVVGAMVRSVAFLPDLLAPQAKPRPEAEEAENSGMASDSARQLKHLLDTHS